MHTHTTNGFLLELHNRAKAASGFGARWLAERVGLQRRVWNRLLRLPDVAEIDW